MEKVVKIKFQAAEGAEPVNAILGMEAPEDLPDGTVGYMLVKTADGVDWAAIPVELPAVGTAGHVLTKTQAGYEWAAAPAEIPAEGTTGHVLTKTEAGYAFQAIPAVEHPIPELPVADGDYKLNITDGVATWVAIV